MEFRAFYNHELHGQAMTALWYDEYRRADKSTRLEARMECLKGVQ